MQKHHTQRLSPITSDYKPISIDIKTDTHWFGNRCASVRLNIELVLEVFHQLIKQAHGIFPTSPYFKVSWKMIVNFKEVTHRGG